MNVIKIATFLLVLALAAYVIAVPQNDNSKQTSQRIDRHDAQSLTVPHRDDGDRKNPIVDQSNTDQLDVSKGEKRTLSLGPLPCPPGLDCGKSKSKANE